MAWHHYRAKCPMAWTSADIYSTYSRLSVISKVTAETKEWEANYFFVSTLHEIKLFLDSSVEDPDDFWLDPDPTFENVRIRILT
jgi:hypothetical protein